MAICGYLDPLGSPGAAATRRARALILCLGAFLPFLPTAAAGVGPERLREGRVLGEAFAIECRDLEGPALGEALAAAEIALARAEAVTRPTVAQSGAAREEPAVAIARREVVRRAAETCVWAGGAHGPLGGALYRHWGLSFPAGAPGPRARPDPEALRRDAERASKDCTALLAALATAAASLEPFEDRLDLRGFERGHAVDRAVDALRAAGSRNGRVRVGPVVRAFGAGPAGLGWPIVLPLLPGQRHPLSPVALHDQSLAIVAMDQHPLVLAGGERLASHLDHRSGEPVRGKVAVLVATEFAVDAEALATALFALATREGEFRLGGLRPKPHVLWLLGTGEGEPLSIDARWSSLGRRR